MLDTKSQNRQLDANLKFEDQGFVTAEDAIALDSMLELYYVVYRNAGFVPFRRGGRGSLQTD